MSTPNLRVQAAHVLSGTLGEIAAGDASSYSATLTPDGVTYADPLNLVPDGYGDDLLQVSCRLQGDIPALALGRHVASINDRQSEGGDAAFAEASFNIHAWTFGAQAVGANDATIGMPWVSPVASFTADSHIGASSFSAVTNFGDGSSAADIITADGNGTWLVTATHTFLAMPTGGLTTTITGPSGASIDGLSSPTLNFDNNVTVSPAPFTVAALSAWSFPPPGQNSTTIGTVTVGTGVAANVNEFSAVYTDNNGEDHGCSLTPNPYCAGQLLVQTNIWGLMNVNYSGTIEVTETAPGSNGAAPTIATASAGFGFAQQWQLGAVTATVVSPDEIDLSIPDPSSWCNSVSDVEVDQSTDGTNFSELMTASGDREFDHGSRVEGAEQRDLQKLGCRG